MVTGTKVHAIRDLQDGLHPFAADTLAPSRFGFLEVFKHIREVCRTFFFTREMPCCSVALVIPVFGANDSVVMSVPVFDVHDTLRSDELATKNITLSINGGLYFDPLKCSVGAVLKYFEAGPNALPQKLGDELTVQISKSRGRRWIELPEPAQMLGDAFEPSFSESIAKTVSTWVHPFVLDGERIFGAFGIDLQTAPNDEQTSALLLLLDTFGLILSGLYHSYYSDLDPPPPAVAQTMGPHWPWESAARVLGRSYLEEIQGRTITEGRCPVGDSKQCLILYGDGNGIKQLNDTYGHETGNEVIRVLGAVLWRSSRETCSESALCKGAVVVRWGGDEFVVVVALTAVEHIKAVAKILEVHIEKNLDQAVKELEGALTTGLGRNVTLHGFVGISIGWSCWNGEQCQKFDEARGAAEDAMYVSKITGKLFVELSKRRPKWFPGKVQNVWVTGDQEVPNRLGLFGRLTGTGTGAGAG
jgi:diguanylate cyclase (GGDEF)-like protein